jgi:hypothetical protein
MAFGGTALALDNYNYILCNAQSLFVQLAFLEIIDNI